MSSTIFFHFTYHVRWNEAQQPHARPETSQSNCRRGWKVNVSWHFFARLRIVTSSYCLMRTYSTERIKITYEKRATIEIHSPYAMNAFIRTSLRYKCVIHEFCSNAYLRFNTNDYYHICKTEIYERKEYNRRNSMNDFPLFYFFLRN